MAEEGRAETYVRPLDNKSVLQRHCDQLTVATGSTEMEPGLRCVACSRQRLLRAKTSQNRRPHLQFLLQRESVRHEVRPLVAGRILYVLAVRLASAQRHPVAELDELHCAHFRWQYAGDVDVVDPEEWRRARRFVHRRYDVD